MALRTELFFEDLLVVSHADQEGSGTNAVNLPGDALGVIVNAGQGIVGEKTAALVAGEADLVADVLHRLGQVEGREVKGGSQALEESLVRSHAQGAAQFGLTDE